MDCIEPILSIASQIYTLVENVKANKNRCRRVCSRVQALEELVNSIRERKTIQTDVEKALKELCVTLRSAEQLIKKYTLSKWVERILKSGSHGEEFNSVNERLNDAFQVLSGALQVEQGNLLFKVFEQASNIDEVDGKKDNAELEKCEQLLVLSMQKEFESVKYNVEKLPRVIDEDIRMIKPDELKYEHPKRAFMKTSTSEVYRGEYRGFTVAIKRYIDPLSTSPRSIRYIFDKEVETMRRFESPNILRMFGICVQNEDGPNPQFLIIMEYCEKGNLREVLDSDAKLSWTRKARMCLDAAQGLYRLHQTEVKSKVHGCITSSKFLVAEGYRVKLGGFELTKTETSLNATKEKDREIRSLGYSSPQMLNDINHVYSKECEMYSFGIVLWEISTRKKPFEGFSNREIYQKVCKEKFKEMLPEDCPESLGDLINACRAYDNFQRPSAGVLLDKLRSVVTQLEEQQ
uniref:Mixed lineage kinase domain like pseudokinase n=1 Tax=Cynoglossus semilaevis TaxID=244447 RepID=A0A3P8UQX3_CYNSE